MAGLMTQDEAREYLLPNLLDFAQRNLTQRGVVHDRDNGIIKAYTFNCPLCGSGTGKNNSASFNVYLESNRYYCFSCQRKGDIFDLYGHLQGVSEFPDQLAGVAEQYGVKYQRIERKDMKQDRGTALDWNSSIGEEGDRPAANEKTSAAGSTAAVTAKASERKEEQPTDYTEYFRKVHANIGSTTYWKDRGLSRETVDRFMVGFDPAWKVSDTAPAAPRLIIPTSRYSFLARDTRKPEEIKGKANDFKKMKRGKVHIFNRKALRTHRDKPTFIVEGELDAMSIAEVGGEAVALGSISYVNRFFEMLDAKKEDGSFEADRGNVFIVALDNDIDPDTGKRKEQVQKAEDELCEGLQKRNFTFYRINPCGSSKDCNDALVYNRELFSGAIREIEDDPEDFMNRQQELEKERLKSEYMKQSAGAHLQDFLNGINESANTPCIPTHFKALDDLLDGGLYPGLYFIGAVTSAGKTSFVLQLADQIAAAGQDILYFSMEMSRTELMSKSISRHTLQLLLESGGDVRNAKTARGITAGHKWTAYSDTEKEVIMSAVLEYGKYAEHIYIHEGVGDIGVDQIKEIVEDHIKYTGTVPVVVIDYVQILSPADVRATDKQNTDKAVLELKRLSRDKNIPVIAISSFNRESYKSGETNVGLWNFKESGAIEYTSDVLIVLNTSSEQSEQLPEGEADIELHILKNRNGRKTRRNKQDNPIHYHYFMIFNMFTETGYDRGKPIGWNDDIGGPYENEPKSRRRGRKSKKKTPADMIDEISADEQFKALEEAGLAKIEITPEGIVSIDIGKDAGKEHD